MKEIKTKQTKKDIKILDKATDVSRRAKSAYIRTKEQSEQLGHDDEGNYVDYAGNSIREGAETIIRNGGYAAENYGKKAVEKIKERRVVDTDSQNMDTQNGESIHQPSKNEEKKAAKENVTKTKTKQTAQQSASSGKGKETAKQKVSQSVVKQKTKQSAVQPRVEEIKKRKLTLSKSSELGKRRFVKNRADQITFQKLKMRTQNKNIIQPKSSQTFSHFTIKAPKNLFSPMGEQKAAQVINSSRKTGDTIKQSVKTGAKAIKKTTKGTIKKSQKSVKTAQRTAKTVVKTSQTAAKTAAKSAQAARRAAQAARLAARATVTSTKMAVKAMVAAIKAIIVAVKGLSALIAAGGWIALVIILVICLAGLLLGSVFGVFFSNEGSGKNTPTMTEVVSWINEEFSEKIEQIQIDNPHDTLEVSGSGSINNVSNWREILPVYAVKTTVDPENGMDVATLDDTKISILRGIFWDMNPIDYWIEMIEHEETITTTDKDGKEIEETITTTETILHIDVTSKTHADMIEEYDFSTEQVNMLNELMQDEYQQLFMQLIGS